MWRLFRELGGYNVSYGDDPNEEEHTDTSSLPLDEIACAGKCKVDLLYADSVNRPLVFFSQKAFAFIQDDKFVSSIYKPDAISRTKTAKKWKHHIAQLIIFSILIAVSWTDVRQTATYFAVEKKTSEQLTARAIFNGRHISDKMEPAPPVNLPAIGDLLEKIGKLQGPKSIIVADFRHWFHQIPISERVSQFFCLSVGSKHYRWSTLPMGVSWSPFVAQSIAWCLLTLNIEHLLKLDATQRLEQPPFFLELIDGGFITVYYDNLLAVGDPEVIDYLSTTWTKSFKRYCVTLKEWNMYSSHQLSGGQAVQYLGVAIERVKQTKKISDGSKNVSFVTRWRQVPCKLEKWKSFLDKCAVSSKLTYRNFSKVCGRIIWSQTLRKHGLCELHPLILILKTAMHQKHMQKAHWDSYFHLSPGDQRILGEYITRTKKNAYIMPMEDVPRQDVWTCSDSSSYGWGFVIFSTQEADPIAKEVSNDWSLEMCNYRGGTGRIHGFDMTLCRCPIPSGCGYVDGVP